MEKIINGLKGISSVYKESDVPVLNICQVYNCLLPRYKVFHTSNSDFWFSYCEKHSKDVKYGIFSEYTGTYAGLKTIEVLPDVELIGEDGCPMCGGGKYHPSPEGYLPIIFTWHSPSKSIDDEQNFITCEKHAAEYKLKIGLGTYTILFEGEMAKKILEKKGIKVKEKITGFKTYKPCTGLYVLNPCVCYDCSEEKATSLYMVKGVTAPMVYLPCKKHEAAYSLDWYTKLTPEEALQYGFFSPTPIFTSCATYGPVSKCAIPYAKSASLHDEFYYNMNVPSNSDSPTQKETEGRLWHVRYSVGPSQYNLVTYAPDEQTARERIIKSEKYNFDSGFEEEMREIAVNPVSGEVLSIYEKSH
jgi:hypothetical protein